MMSVEISSPEQTLELLERFSFLVDDYAECDKPGNTKKRTATSAEMNRLAGLLAIEAEVYQCRYGAAPFAGVARNWWRCTELEVPLTINELRAKLTVAIRSEQRQPAGQSQVISSSKNGDSVPNQSKPVSLRKAAQAMGRSGDKTGAEWMKRSIEEGSITAKQLSRQSYVFDLGQFPEDKRHLLK